MTKKTPVKARKIKPVSPVPAELRQKAEMQSRDAGGEMVLTPEKTRKVLHELRVHQIELEMQNEELRRLQTQLEISHAIYFDLFDLAPVGYLVISEKGLILEANLTAASQLGAPRGDLLKQLFSHYIFTEDEDIYYFHRKKLLSTGTVQRCELRIRKNDNTVFWVNLESSLVQDESSAGTCRITVTDIGKRKQVEAEAAIAFRESQKLLDELQHRAKNSFGMITSMISLAANASLSREAKELLAVLDSRVRAISELYSLLYTAGSFTEVHLDEYCARIASSLISLGENITLNTEMEKIMVSVKEAAPFGLILTELITNAVKYAFPGGRIGNITFELKKASTHIHFEVRDNGIGLPAAFDLSRSAGMGLNIVKALAGQINGRFKIESSSSGTRCVVEFVEKKGQRPKHRQ